MSRSVKLGNKDLVVTRSDGSAVGYVVTSENNQPSILHRSTAPNPPISGGRATPVQSGGMYDVRDSEGDKAITYIDWSGGAGQVSLDRDDSSASRFYSSSLLDTDTPGELKLARKFEYNEVVGAQGPIICALGYYWMAIEGGGVSYSTDGTAWTAATINNYAVSTINDFTTDGKAVYFCVPGTGPGVWKSDMTHTPFQFDRLNTDEVYHLAYLRGMIWAAKTTGAGHLNVSTGAYEEDTMDFMSSLTSIGLEIAGNTVYWVVSGTEHTYIYSLYYSPDTDNVLCEQVAEFRSGFIATCCFGYLNTVYVGGYYLNASANRSQGVVYAYTQGESYLLTTIGRDPDYYTDIPDELMNHKVISLMAGNDKLYIQTPSSVYSWDIVNGGYHHLTDVFDSSTSPISGGSDGDAYSGLVFDYTAYQCENQYYEANTVPQLVYFRGRVCGPYALDTDNKTISIQSATKASPTVVTTGTPAAEMVVPTHPTGAAWPAEWVKSPLYPTTFFSALADEFKFSSTLVTDIGLATQSIACEPSTSYDYEIVTQVTTGGTGRMQLGLNYYNSSGGYVGSDLLRARSSTDASPVTTSRTFTTPATAASVTIYMFGGEGAISFDVTSISMYGGAVTSTDLETGDIVYLDINSVPAIIGYYKVTVLTASTFKVVSLVTGSEVGVATTAGTSGTVSYNKSRGIAIESDSYADQGTIQSSTSSFHTGTMAKDFRRIEVMHDPLIDGDIISAAYSLNGANFQVATLESTSENKTTFSIHQTGYSIAVKIDVVPASDAATPIIRSWNVIWDFLKVDRHLYTLDCRKGTQEGRWNVDATTAIQHLMDAADEEATFEDRFASYTGIIEQIEYQQAFYSQKEGPSGLVTIQVREIPAEPGSYSVSTGAGVDLDALVVRVDNIEDRYPTADAVNYTEFEADGTMVMHGNATVWEDLRVEPTVRGTGARNPSFEKYIDDVAGTSIGLYLYSFDDALVAAEKEVYFSMQMPHAWAGTPIYLHVHWVGSAADTTAAPRWGCEYAWSNIGGTYTDSATVYGINKYPADTDITALKHYITTFTAIDPSTTANGLSSVLIGRLFRNSSDAADTYNVGGNKCGLLYIDAHYESDTLGSRSELAK